MSNGPSRAAEADFTPITPARLQWQDHTPVATDFDDLHKRASLSPVITAE